MKIAWSCLRFDWFCVFGSVTRTQQIGVHLDFGDVRPDDAITTTQIWLMRISSTNFVVRE